MRQGAIFHPVTHTRTMGLSQTIHFHIQIHLESHFRGFPLSTDEGPSHFLPPSFNYDMLETRVPCPAGQDAGCSWCHSTCSSVLGLLPHSKAPCKAVQEKTQQFQSKTSRRGLRKKAKIQLIKGAFPFWKVIILFGILLLTGQHDNADNAMKTPLDSTDKSKKECSIT